MVIANTQIDTQKLKIAAARISQLQNELPTYIAQGSGPFLAALYDENGTLIAQEANSVVSGKCSHHHAEMNVIQAAEKKLGTYDLSPYHLSLYVTAEPCTMCIGGILWSGIQSVYYGVSSKKVEQITGFDEGFKPHWLEEFQKRNITVYGEIETALGEKVLQDYVAQGQKVYRPERTSTPNS